MLVLELKRPGRLGNKLLLLCAIRLAILDRDNNAIGELSPMQIRIEWEGTIDEYGADV